MQCVPDSKRSKQWQNLTWDLSTRSTLWLWSGASLQPDRSTDPEKNCYACYKKYPLFDNLPARMWLWWVSIRTFNHVQPRKIFWNHGVLINDHHDEIGQNTWKWKWDNITSLSISLLNWSIWNCLSLGLIYTYISLTFVQPDKVVHCSQFWV